MTPRYSIEDIKSMKYAQLQKLAKKHGIKANQKGAKLISVLTQLLCKADEKSQEVPPASLSLDEGSSFPKTSPSASSEHVTQTTPTDNSFSQSETRRSTYVLPCSSLPNTPTILKNRRSEFTQHDLITASEEFKRIVSKVTPDASRDNSNNTSSENSRGMAEPTESPHLKSASAAENKQLDCNTSATEFKQAEAAIIRNATDQSADSQQMEMEMEFFDHLNDSLKVPKLPTIDIGNKTVHDNSKLNTIADGQIPNHLILNTSVDPTEETRTHNDDANEEQITTNMEVDDHELTTLTQAEMMEDNLMDSIIGVADNSRRLENGKMTPYQEKVVMNTQKHEFAGEGLTVPAVGLNLEEKITATEESDWRENSSSNQKEITTADKSQVETSCDKLEIDVTSHDNSQFDGISHDKSQLDVASSQEATKSRRATYSLDSSTVLLNSFAIEPQARDSIHNKGTDNKPINEHVTNAQRSDWSETVDPASHTTDDWMKALDHRLNKAVQDEDIESRVDKKLTSLTSDNKKHTSKTPNFKALHARHFSKMTDITQVYERRNKMAAASKSPFSNRPPTHSTNTASSLTKRPLSGKETESSGPKIVKPIRGGSRPIGNEKSFQRPPQSPARLINKSTPGKPSFTTNKAPVKPLKRTPAKSQPLSENRNIVSSLQKSTQSSAMKKTPTRQDPTSKSPGRQPLFTMGTHTTKPVVRPTTKRTSLKCKSGQKVLQNRTSELRRLAALKENQNKRSQMTMIKRKV